MKKLIIILVAVLSCLCASAESMDPVANSGSVVVCGNARFTILGSRLIRMEWSADGKFEDRATLGVVNRNFPPISFSSLKNGKNVTISTGDVLVEYKGPAKFSAKNLKVTFTMNGKKVTWRPGDSDSGNLLGTARTLDKFDGVTMRDAYDKGVISRDGWAILDESDRHVFVSVKEDWKHWVEPRTDVDRADWYFFGYGHDYMKAVSDFTKIAGRVPLPPKYTFGYWWCRYWQYSDFEFLDLADHFEAYNIPVDVMIVDMDWHDTFTLTRKGAPTDEFGQRIGWTGYTWKKELFPSPSNFVEELHRRNIRTSLNLHPASGIQPYEECYDRFVKDYTSRTQNYDGPKGYVYGEGGYTFAGNEKPCGNAGEKAPVPFRMSQMQWADAYFNSVIHPLQKDGIDFWWLDWQQWKESKYMKDLSNTFWLNYTFFNDLERQSVSQGKDAKRPMIYHRWGGIGSHRYQVGFSGDTYASWTVLGAIPYFTATASNVGYGYWGHDIGGHMQPKGVTSTDPELYTRWIQSGVFTPVFKTHSTKDRTMEKRFWVFPDHFDPMREAIRLRYDLSPYIYAAARQTTDSGISICRPLYYYYPEEDKAYTENQEFFFGDNILATTVCHPADPITGLAPRHMWFPAGYDWYDMSTGTLYQGGTEADLSYTINENPWFVRAGAVIPMAGENIKNLQIQDNETRYLVVPGLGESSTILYEDDGMSQAYGEDFATTSVYKNTDPMGVSLLVSARQGDFKGALPTRRIRLVLDGAEAPSSVTINGSKIPYSRHAELDAAEGKEVWGYDGSTLRVTVYVAETSVNEPISIRCETKFAFVAGEKARIRRARALTPEYKEVFAAGFDPYKMLPDGFLVYSQCASFIDENPWGAADYIKSLNPVKMADEYNAKEGLSKDFARKLSEQLK